MAKFGLFKTGSSLSEQEYEGDHMDMEKEFVRIKKRGTIERPHGEILAVIRLEKGFDVRKIAD